MDIALIVATGLFTAFAVGVSVIYLMEWVDRKVTSRMCGENVVDLSGKSRK